MLKAIILAVVLSLVGYMLEHHAQGLVTKHKIIVDTIDESL